MSSQMIGWISVIFFILCLSIFLKRVYLHKQCPFLKQVYRYHQVFAWGCLGLSLIHGIIANKTDAMMSGKVVWMIFLIFMILSYYQKRMSHMIWKKIHIFLSMIICIGIIYHICVSII